MRGIKTTGAEEANRHCCVAANQGGEGDAVCADRVAPFAFRCGRLGGWIEEVEDEVRIAGDQIDAVDGFWGGKEGVDDIGVVGNAVSRTTGFSGYGVEVGGGSEGERGEEDEAKR